MYRFKLFLLTTALVLLSVSPLIADIHEDLARDFAPLEGVVVLPLEGEFLVDLDSEQGLQQGDLLAVIKEGAPVVHPVTKEILGRLDEVKAVLKVVRIKSGYSYAEPIGDASGVKSGDKLKRAENLRTLFWDYTGSGEAVYSEAKQAVPHLEWQGYSASQLSRPPTLQLLDKPLRDADLVFVLQNGKLQVRDGRLQVLYAYNLPGAQVSQSTSSGLPLSPSITPAAVAVQPGPRGQAIDPNRQVGIVRNKVQQDGRAVWLATSYKQAPAAIDVADFDGDGQLETAVVFSERVEIGRHANGRWQVLQSLKAVAGTQLLTADSADLDGDGRFELYLTATDLTNGLASQVVESTGQEYRVLEDGIDMFFRVVPLPGEGRVLLGQQMGSKEDFFGPVFRVVREKGRVAQGKALDLPSSISLFGFLPVQTGESAQIYLWLNEYDRLLVKSADGQALLEGDTGFGGSMKYVVRDDPDIVADPLVDIRKLYLQARMDVDDQGHPLVPANSGFTISRQAKSYTKSQVIAYDWNAGNLQELWKTSPQNGYLADFRYVDFDNDGTSELVMALAPKGGFLSDRSGNLTVYEF